MSALLQRCESASHVARVRSDAFRISCLALRNFSRVNKSSAQLQLQIKKFPGAEYAPTSTKKAAENHMTFICVIWFFNKNLQGVTEQLED